MKYLEIIVNLRKSGVGVEGQRISAILTSKKHVMSKQIEFGFDPLLFVVNPLLIPISIQARVNERGFHSCQLSRIIRDISGFFQW